MIAKGEEGVEKYGEGQAVDRRDESDRHVGAGTPDKYKGGVDKRTSRCIFMSEACRRFKRSELSQCHGLSSCI